MPLGQEVQNPANSISPSVSHCIHIGSNLLQSEQYPCAVKLLLEDRKPNGQVELINDPV
jgi:hypothetical protein